jgi:hypothetical protein
LKEKTPIGEGSGSFFKVFFKLKKKLYPPMRMLTTQNTQTFVMAIVIFNDDYFHYFLFV